ncbi:MAG: 2-amino-4-hydroxy-6-hydroxymethyldihydropteridine diphosphokinase [Caldisericia bacterium]|nr:2-amino-4-hydroxy-6-hydroxymethyldihydropteridine diphosphokinase [Caldisericia bacterium]
MNSVLFSIGSNIGRRKSNIEEAISFLLKSGFSIFKRSSIIETKPYGGIKQNHFLNLVLFAKTNQSDPFSILMTIKKIEKKMGRIETHRWGPRLIDIDILFWNQDIVNSPTLNIPHCDIQNRDFVLLPLLEICPLYFHPVFKTTIITIWNIYKKNDIWYHVEKLYGGST